MTDQRCGTLTCLKFGPRIVFVSTALSGKDTVLNRHFVWMWCNLGLKSFLSVVFAYLHCLQLAISSLFFHVKEVLVIVTCTKNQHQNELDTVVKFMIRPWIIQRNDLTFISLILRITTNASSGNKSVPQLLSWHEFIRRETIKREIIRQVMPSWKCFRL